jgi:hypothetical protein
MQGPAQIDPSAPVAAPRIRPIAVIELLIALAQNASQKRQDLGV